MKELKVHNKIQKKDCLMLIPLKVCIKTNKELQELIYQEELICH
jgi:hypothetical protein